MLAHVLRGTKQEIVENLIRMSGEVREAVVFVDEQASLEMRDRDEFFAEMRPFMVEVKDLDDDRDAIYAPVDLE